MQETENKEGFIVFWTRERSSLLISRRGNQWECFA